MFRTAFFSNLVMLRKQFVIQCLLGILLFTSLSSCRKSNPLTSEEITPGRRDYFWHVDTLDMPMNFLYSIWGSSPSDIWACGPGGDYNKWLQHYDGKKWTPYTKNGIIPCPGNTLWGFARNDVWMGGDDGEIWHYDGSNWNRNFTYNISGAKNVTVQSIWGTGAQDIYASGVIFYKSNAWDPESNKGFILHYDGQNWTEICKGEFNSQFPSIRKEGEKVYVFSFTFSSSGDDISTCYKLDGNQLKKIYPSTLAKTKIGSIHCINNKVYFSIGNEICEYINDSFIRMISVPGENFGYIFSGRSWKDIFITMNDGLLHYNGEDMQYIYHISGNTILANEPAIFEKDIFYCLYDRSSGKNMIVHGKLKE